MKSKPTFLIWPLDFSAIKIKLDSLARTVGLIFLAWTFGFLLGLFFWSLVITRRIEYLGYWQLLKLIIKTIFEKRGLVFYANHPDLWMPICLPGLLFPWYLFFLRFAPFLTPDKQNYCQRWWFKPFLLICIPIDRGNPREEAKAFWAMMEALNRGRVVYFFPEGGRTYKGTDFKISQNGKRIRRFKLGIGKLVSNTRAIFLPIWTEGGEQVMPNQPCQLLSFPRFWRKTRIKIGEPLVFGERIPRKEAVEILEDALLKLTEE